MAVNNNDQPGSEPAAYCTACATQLPSVQLITLECEDPYCKACLEKLLELSIKDETMYPAGCCGYPINLKKLSKHIPPSLIRRVAARKLELSTKDKTYCHKHTCSTFIAPHSTHNYQAICQRCNAVTCSKCKQEWHFGPCEEGPDLLLDLIRLKRWKKCGKCSRIIEKTSGCNHVLCRCGFELCYGCGNDVEDCACRSDAETDYDYSDDDEAEWERGAIETARQAAANRSQPDEQTVEGVAMVPSEDLLDLGVNTE